MDDIAPIIAGFSWLSDGDKKLIFEDNARRVFNLSTVASVREDARG